MPISMASLFPSRAAPQFCHAGGGASSLSIASASCAGCRLPVLPSRTRRRASRRRRCTVRGAAVATPTRALQYRKLGDSDLLISEVTLGTMTWGNQNTEKEAHEQLCYAFDNGINILDTAEVYPVPVSKGKEGNTDSIISTWLKSRPRDKVLIATKVSGYSERETDLRNTGTGTRVNAANIKESIEKSLSRLGTDHIDLLQIHWPDRYVPLFGKYMYDPLAWRESTPFSEQLEAFRDVIEEGKVRYIGVSNETSYGVMEFVQAAKMLSLPKIVSIQNSYSLLVRCQYEVNLVEVCDPRHCNVGLLAYSPLAGGVLTGKYIDVGSDAAKKGRLSIFPGYMDRYQNSLPKEAVKKYADLARRHGLTPTQLALGFVRDQPFVTSTIIGATSLEQLSKNVAAFTSARPLSDEVFSGISDIFNQFRDPTLL